MSPGWGDWDWNPESEGLSLLVPGTPPLHPSIYLCICVGRGSLGTITSEDSGSPLWEAQELGHRAPSVLAASHFPFFSPLFLPSELCLYSPGMFQEALERSNG